MTSKLSISIVSLTNELPIYIGHVLHVNDVILQYNLLKVHKSILLRQRSIVGIKTQIGDFQMDGGRK